MNHNDNRSVIRKLAVLKSIKVFFHFFLASLPILVPAIVVIIMVLSVAGFLSFLNPWKMGLIDDVIPQAVNDVKKSGIGHGIIRDSVDQNCPINDNGKTAPINIDLLKSIFTLTYEETEHEPYSLKTSNVESSLPKARKFVEKKRFGDYDFIDIKDEIIKTTNEEGKPINRAVTYSQFKTTNDILSTFSNYLTVDEIELLKLVSFYGLDEHEILPSQNKTFKGALSLPCKNATISSYFGWRWLNNVKNYHCGIDFRTNLNHTNILSIADGKVKKIYDLNFFKANPNEPQNFGQQIIIEHKLKDLGGKYRKFFSIYCHLSTIYVNVGDTVKQGQVIGKMGGELRSNGTSEVGLKESTTGHHLHFEIRNSIRGNYQGRNFSNKVSCNCLDPMEFLRKSNKNQIIKNEISPEIS